MPFSEWLFLYDSPTTTKARATTLQFHNISAQSSWSRLRRRQSSQRRRQSWAQRRQSDALSVGVSKENAQ